MTITVNLALATICFMGTCHNALVGPKTPVGQFQLVQLITEQPGYGGDVLQFESDDTQWFAIHRLYLLNPAQKRQERIKSADPLVRTITDGCINVDPPVYEAIKECCLNETLIIKKN